MNKTQYKMKTPLGALYLVASEKGLCGVFWKQPKYTVAKNLRGSSDEVKFISQAAEELTDYFDGTRKVFKVRLHFEGTKFQERVWRELIKIPYGQLWSYRDIAQRIEHPKAFRAVGTANGKNPLSIIIPCHRVINANGDLGGYSAGLSLKNKLLKIENSQQVLF